MGAEHNIDVSYVAGLARLEIEPAAMKRLQQDMEAIVDYIEQLKELDVEGIEPTAHAMPLANVWREDVAGETFKRETMLANAPGTVDDELLKVPQVLPGEGMA
ncbi:MAG: Asp-tRNA(Asn)/Glu-tRNA(Gln) amidotransferase subunit GatC [Victivallaceae bacterium]